MLLTFFFFNDTATTEIYTLSLHDALPICAERRPAPDAVAAGRTHLGQCATGRRQAAARRRGLGGLRPRLRDRKSTRLNSSHSQISYAVFCLKKKINPPHVRPSMLRNHVRT